MARGGVILDSHYVFQVCAPTRASTMTGRYPWGIGFYYVGGDNLGVPLQYEMLPQALRRLAKAQNGTDVATAAIGKWHNGALLKAYTPTYRGFESYFGYCEPMQYTTAAVRALCLSLLEKALTNCASDLTPDCLRPRCRQ